MIVKRLRKTLTWEARTQRRLPITATTCHMYSIPAFY